MDAPAKPQPVRRAQAAGDDVARSSGFEWLSRAGFVSRGLVYGIVAIFLIKAAIDYNPNAAVGLDGALRKLANASYGPVLLGIIAFSVYSLSDARYHRI